MEKDAKIFVAGHNGLVGRAVVKELKAQGFTNILTVERKGPWGVDLRDKIATRWLFSCHAPQYVFMCAAKVGGIKANMENPIEFFQENVDIQNNVFENAAIYGTEKLLFLGSSCIYPKHCEQPIKPESLLTGSLEPTNAGYALAKIAGVKLCQWYQEKRGKKFISAMPCNLYGPGDNFHETDGHLVPGLMARMIRAKRESRPEFWIWGDGTARRELLFSEDLARALIVAMEKYDGAAPLNTGSGEEITVADLARKIKSTVYYHGQVYFDANQPVGVTRKIMDNAKLFELGWKPEVSLDEGLKRTYEDFVTSPQRRGSANAAPC